MRLAEGQIWSVVANRSHGAAQVDAGQRCRRRKQGHAGDSSNGQIGHKASGAGVQPENGRAGRIAAAERRFVEERSMARNIRKPAARKQGSTTPARPVLVMVATRKGAWLYRGDAGRNTWRAEGPHFLGHIISHMVLDPRDGRTLLAAAKTGHLGPTVFRSTDFGRTWKEAAQPPAFAKAQSGKQGRAVDHTFWLTPGHASQPGVWYAGTSPQGLFRSEDAGDTWAPVAGLNDDPAYR